MVQRCSDVALGWRAFNPCDRQGQGLLDLGCGTYDKKNVPMGNGGTDKKHC
jgi:hypothetical protein